MKPAFWTARREVRPTRRWGGAASRPHIWAEQQLGFTGKAQISAEQVTVISAQGFVTSAWIFVTSAAGFGETACGFVMIVPGGVTNADDPGKLAVPEVTAAKGTAKAV